MYISRAMIDEIERKFGVPREIDLRYEMTPREFEMVRRSQKHGRAHDVTLYIIEANRVVVIRKPKYPPGAYRAPSGGVAQGELFETGALREAHEETGLVVSLHSYILRANVEFTLKSALIKWTTHVFTARRLSGYLRPIDTTEIGEAKLATIDELTGSIKEALLASGSTGLRYRSDLNDEVVRTLIDRSLLHSHG